MNAPGGIATILDRQFARMWAMLRGLVEACPQEQWLAGAAATAIPARQAYHILAAAEWCCDEDRFDKTNPFGVRFSEELFGDNLPSVGWPDKHDMLRMIEDVQRRIAARIASMADADWPGPARTPMDFGQTDLEQFVYALRHSQHHVGELRAELRRRGLHAVDWE